MKIINFKLNISKIVTIISVIIAILFVILAMMRFFNITKTDEIVMTNDNYTDVLKDCHENIDKTLHKKIITTGYIFRPSDIKEDEFVIARDMLINQNEAQIVGFLAKYEFANEFDDNVWVEIHGEIIKGDYHGEIPIIKVNKIKKITTPEDIFVHPPKE